MRKEESRRRGIRAGWARLKGNCGGERDLTPWKVTYLTERSTKSEGSTDAEKSTAVSLRSEEQSANQTDHLNYWHSHQKPRCLGGGWALRPWLCRLVPGSKLGWVVWRLLRELGTSMLGWQGRDSLGD